MPDITIVFWLVAGFGFLLAIRALLNADTGLADLYPQGDDRDWPRGVQEPDLPRFAIEHLDALQPHRSLEGSVAA